MILREKQLSGRIRVLAVEERRGEDVCVATVIGDGYEILLKAKPGPPGVTYGLALNAEEARSLIRRLIELLEN